MSHLPTLPNMRSTASLEGTATAMEVRHTRRESEAKGVPRLHLHASYSFPAEPLNNTFIPITYHNRNQRLLQVLQNAQPEAEESNLETIDEILDFLTTTKYGMPIPYLWGYFVGRYPKLPAYHCNYNASTKNLDHQHWC